MVIINDITHNVTKDKSLKIASARFYSGEITGIFGLSGSGKTAFLELIGSRKAYSGSITLKGSEISSFEKKDYEKSVSFIPADPCRINGESKVYDTVLKGRKAFRKRFSPYSDHDRETAAQCIDMFKAAPLSGRKIKRLTSSQLQCIMLARSFSSQAELLMLDNPEKYLNILQQNLLSRALKKYVLNGKRTIIMASNDLDFLSENCDRLILIDNGEFKISGTPDILTDELIKDVFGINVIISRNILTGRPQIQVIEDI